SHPTSPVYPLPASSTTLFFSSSLFFHPPLLHRDPHSFPTRRSSDLIQTHTERWSGTSLHHRSLSGPSELDAADHRDQRQRELELDRKSTRLNSSHQIISYAVFCLKKKKDN